MHLIPHSWAHWHILVSLLPSVGLFFALCLYGIGIYTDKDIIKRACLIIFVLIALATVPTYLSGDHSMTALAGNPRIPEDHDEQPLQLERCCTVSHGGDRNRGLARAGPLLEWAPVPERAASGAGACAW